jgi:hypothetical protein
MTPNLPSTSTSPLSPIPAFDRGLADAIAAVRNTAEQRGEVTVLRAAIPHELRERMRTRLSRLLAGLQGGNTDDLRRVGVAVAALLDCFPSLRRADARDVTAKFVSEVKDLPAWAVEKACAQMRRGEVSDVSVDFPPSTVRLRQVTVGIMAEPTQEAFDIRRLLTAEVEHQPTAEERERVTLGFKRLVGDLQRQRHEERAAAAPARTFTAPSDDDLRRLYPKREAAE